MTEVDKTSAKVKIERVAGVDPITQIAYISSDRPGGYSQWQPEPGKDAFEVSAELAAAAVESGGFRVTEDSRVKLKPKKGGE